MISSVVALQTALARPWPARLCLAARIRSLRVCPPAVCISDEVAGSGAVLAAIWNWYPECCGCIYQAVWCDGVCVWCVMGLAALGPTWQQQQLSPHSTVQHSVLPAQYRYPALTTSHHLYSLKNLAITFSLLQTHLLTGTAAHTAHPQYSPPTTRTAAGYQYSEWPSAAAN